MSYQSDHLLQRLKGQREFIVLLATRMREEPDKEIVAMLDRFIPDHISLLRKNGRNKHFVCGVEAAYKAFCAEMGDEKV